MQSYIKNLKNNQEIMSIETRIKPVLSLKYYTLHTAWIVCALAIFLTIGSKNEIKDFSNIFCLIFIIITCIIIPVQMVRYYYTEFIIDKSRVSHIRDFLGYYRNDIQYENIKEIIIKRGLIKKLFGLGDIYLISNISSNSAGVTFFNIKNPLQVYELLQEKIAQHKK
jgi:hypothetical protein